MARVTVEDCVERVPNRFEIVLLAARRSREIAAGAMLTVDRDNDKNPVVSLREIGDGTIDIETLRNNLIHSLQRRVEIDEPEDDNMAALMSASSEWAGVIQGNLNEDSLSTEDVGATDGDAAASDVDLDDPFDDN